MIDVYPEKLDANAPKDPSMRGFELMIAGDVLRGRYRNSHENPEPVAPDSIQHYEIAFPGNDHVFLKGHRMMVQVQSTWFPVIDRNPQKFVPNTYKASPEDYQAATQRVYHSKEFASYIDLPVKTE